MPINIFLFLFIYYFFLSGLEDVDNACCGSGLYETSYLCNRLSPICPNDSKFLFWDSLHLTDKGYNIVVDHALPRLMQCLH